MFWITLGDSCEWVGDGGNPEISKKCGFGKPFLDVGSSAGASLHHVVSAMAVLILYHLLTYISGLSDISTLLICTQYTISCAMLQELTPSYTWEVSIQFSTMHWPNDKKPVPRIVWICPLNLALVLCFLYFFFFACLSVIANRPGAGERILGRLWIARKASGTSLVHLNLQIHLC